MQTGSGGKLMNGPAPYVTVAEAGPGSPSGLVAMGSSQTAPTSNASPVGFTPAVVAVAQSLLFWMGL